MLPEHRGIPLPRGELKRGQNHRLKVLGHESSECDGGLWATAPLVEWLKMGVQQLASRTPGRDFTDRPENLRAQHSGQSAVRPDHVFPPACHPHFSSPTSDKQTTDRKSTRLNSSHVRISYAVFCLKKKNILETAARRPPTNYADDRNQAIGTHQCRFRREALPK